MTRSVFLCTALLILFGGSSSISAQNGAIGANRSGKPHFDSVPLDPNQKRKMEFELKAPGDVSGRVFGRMGDVDDNAEDAAIVGVKVTLRSRDAGFENFIFEQFTDADGKYEFPYLRPGRYVIVIDPTDQPTVIRSSTSDLRTP
jgi:hypothetical protein